MNLPDTLLGEGWYWAATDNRLGNNPIVIAVPFGDEAIVLDMAMSQYSYGKMEMTSFSGKKLDFPGGYNRANELSKDPDEILESGRPLPIGYWKGAGLSLLLDILSTVLSGGLSTGEISKQMEETSLSQVYIAIDIQKLHHFSTIQNTISEIISDYKSSVPVNENSDIRYPGESVLKIRQIYLKEGIPVNSSVWDEILGL